MRYEPAKSLLAPVRAGEEFFRREYNMNLYRGCSHGCIYCDTRSVCYHVDDPGEVRAKEDALGILRAELRGKKSPGIVGFGSMSDPYNPEEGELRLARGALELLSEHGFGAWIITKSALAARDADVLLTVMKYAPAHVTFTITAHDDVLCRRIEPRVSASGERLAAMAELAGRGILTGAWVSPVLPFITDSWEDNLKPILSDVARAGGKYAMCFFGMTLREGNREYFYEALDREFPGLKRRYAETYGNAYEIAVPDARRIYRLYAAECERLGLAYTFDEINRLIGASGGGSQLTMF